MQTVRTRKRGKTYSYIFEAGKVNGKRKPVEKGGFATADEAYTAGMKALLSFKRGDKTLLSEKVLLKDFLDNWLEKHIKDNVKQLTYKAYSYNVNHYINPALGNIKLQSLTPKMVDDMIHDLIKRLSKATVTSIKATLTSALNYAIYPCELINENPARFIKIPNKDNRQRVVKRIIIGKETEERLYARYPEGTNFYIVLKLLMYTGLRVSEVCGLTWDNIDFDNNKITVDKQLQVLKKISTIQDPKRKTSCRTIMIDRNLVADLSAWKQYQKKKLISYYDKKTRIVISASANFSVPKEYEPLDFVCTKADGSFMNSSYIDNILWKFGVNAHSYRHTHATRLAEMGVRSKAIAYRLGHKTTEITDNLYTTHTEKMEKELISKLETFS